MILAAFFVLLGAFVRSASGFGYALIVTPLLMLVMDPKSVVVINILLVSTTHIIVLYYVKRNIDFRRAILLGTGSIPGIPIGAYLLSSLDPAIIKLAIAALVIPFSVLLLLGHSHHFQRDSLGCGIAGFIGGILIASTSLGGPPAVLFLLNQGMVKERFVGTLAVYFLVTSIASIFAFSSLGMITGELLKTVALLLPTLWLGSFAGIKLLPKINTNLFKKLASVIVSVTALAIIINFLLELSN